MQPQDNAHLGLVEGGAILRKQHHNLGQTQSQHRGNSASN